MTSEETKEETAPAIGQETPAAKLSFWASIRAAFSQWWRSGTVVIEKQSSGTLARTRTNLAATRTLMAADRTLMAWIRTALSLLSFGFTIYKILQGFQEAGAPGLPAQNSPRNIGLFLTGMGTVAMIMGTIEYVATLRELHVQMDFKLARPPLIMAILMSITGLFLFFAIITQLF